MLLWSTKFLWFFMAQWCKSRNELIPVLQHCHVITAINSYMHGETHVSFNYPWVQTEKDCLHFRHMSTHGQDDLYRLESEYM